MLRVTRKSRYLQTAINVSTSGQGLVARCSALNPTATTLTSGASWVPENSRIAVIIIIIIIVTVLVVISFSNQK